MKRILLVAFWIAIIAGVSFLFIFSNNKQEKLICPEFQINVNYDNAPILITQGNIRQQITKNNIKIRGNEIGSIDVEKIQKLLDKNPFIKQASITIGVNGVVKADLNQRNPIVRVIDRNGTQFYIDDEGSLIPLSPEFPARVIIASGNIGPVKGLSNKVAVDKNQPRYKSLPADLQQVYKTAMALRNDVFSNALIEQIYINETGETELFAKIGNQNIILGDTARLNEKLNNLAIFYTKGMKNTGWDNYKTINLKFRNQVVCTKTK